MYENHKFYCCFIPVLFYKAHKLLFIYFSNSKTLQSNKRRVPNKLCRGRKFHRNLINVGCRLLGTQEY